MEILGIDVGGSGIKGASEDIATGALTAEPYRLSTPHPATPDAVADQKAPCYQRNRKSRSWQTSESSAAPRQWSSCGEGTHEGCSRSL